ncbi:MAG: hypothetical protein GY847_08750 [Proteobacteria bacterium]|nr:hypothetical protein [Pseudomonadota bacterium]
MRCIVRFSFVVTALLLTNSVAFAERLEVGLAVTPTMLQDTQYEAFSEDDLNKIRFGADIRSEVINLGGFRLIPLIGYRIAFDHGSPYSIMDTDLVLHDIIAGLRVRKGLLSWLALCVEITGGVLLADMNSSPNQGYDMSYGDLGARQDYEDFQHTWSFGGLAGVDIQLSKNWLRSRGVRRFGFAGEIAGGYVRRGDIEFEPSLEGGDDSSIEAETRPWGDVNLSGWMVQAAVSFRFF